VFSYRNRCKRLLDLSACWTKIPLLMLLLPLLAPHKVVNRLLWINSVSVIIVDHDGTHGVLGGQRDTCRYLCLSINR